MAPDSPSRLPPRQQLVGLGKWPVVGENASASRPGPWTVSLAGLVAPARQFTLDELSARVDFDDVLDIHCVTRWSKYDVRFRGVRLRSLLAETTVDPTARFISFVARSDRRHSTSLPLGDIESLEPVVALEADGAPLGTQHGGPVRLIVPGRYFYKSVKWLETIELLAEDRLGYWEANAGYHNHADPWLEERFVSPSFSKREAQERLASRDFRDCELLGFDGRQRDLREMKADHSRLRDADFRGANLRGASFAQANLSGARFATCDLRQAVFREADCEGADFSAADLRGADFTGASLFGASFFSDEESRGANEPSRTIRLGPDFPFSDHQLAMLTDQQVLRLNQVPLESLDAD